MSCSDSTELVRDICDTKGTIISALRILLTSKTSSDLKLVALMLEYMGKHWGLGFDEAFCDEVFVALMDQNSPTSARNWLARMHEKSGSEGPSREQWNLLLRWCLHTQNGNHVQSILKDMRRLGCTPDSEAYGILFDALFQQDSFPRYSEVEEIISDMQKDGVPFTRALLDLLLERYERAGSAALCAQVTTLFESLRPSASSTATDPGSGLDRNEALSALVTNDKDGAVKLLKAYLRKGFRPTRDTLEAMSRTIYRIGDLSFWERKLGVRADSEILAMVIQNAAFRGTSTDRYNALEAYRAVGRRGIRKTFEMFFPILRATCTTSFKAPSDHTLDQSLTYLDEFLQDSDEAEHRKSFPIYDHLLRATTSSQNRRKYLPIAVNLVEDMQTRQVMMDAINWTSVIIMLMDCCQYSSEAFDIYRKFHKTRTGQYALDGKGYTAVVNNFCKRSFAPGDTDSAVRYFDIMKDMRLAGHRIPTKIYSNVLVRLNTLWKETGPEDDAARAEIISHTRRTHQMINLDGSLVPDVPLWNRLMETYNRFGCFRDVRELWQSMFVSGDFDNNTVTIIIHACTSALADNVATDIYRKLFDRGFVFDMRNWKNWLGCLCRMGKVDEAVKVLCLEMAQLSSVQPDLECARIILRYASRTNEEELVRSRIDRHLPGLLPKIS
ncbi:hypothetical protein BXZ70DRAFT_293941 [Cristinia sonorae]|uniref:Pentatricopeptide repeat-containing protein n=1 Tax=Cristinia sonorae TaxID=1940300 RepID=A0A8K0XNT4_9AGAR|nr:hypothetical protein BXZ70DRAFT_293941 [Cristinia sonorae]